MKKNILIFIIGMGVLIIVAYFFVLHPYTIQIYDTWMEFNYPSYSNNQGYAYRLAAEWRTKPSSFLYRQLKLPNSKSRKGLAIGILSERKDKGVLPILKSTIAKGDPDLNYQYTQCLIQFGTEIAAPVLMKIIDKYNQMKFESTDKKTWKDAGRYFDALCALAQLKYEPVYSLMVNLAKNGTEYEKQAVFGRALYHYDNHWEEVLFLYKNRLKNYGEYKSGIIGNIKNLNRPEAIPILKDLAEKEPWNRKDAEEAIKYLESLKTR